MMNHVGRNFPKQKSRQGGGVLSSTINDTPNQKFICATLWNGWSITEDYFWSMRGGVLLGTMPSRVTIWPRVTVVALLFP